MIQRLFLGFAASLIVFVAAIAFADSSINNNPGSQPDPTAAHLSDISTSAAATLASAIAAQPAPCATIPLSDTLNGSLGSTPCFTKATDTRATNVQRINAMADSSGNWTVTFARPFSSSSPIVNPLAVNPSGTQPIICNVKTRSTTVATGTCWATIQTTLPGVALSLLGLLINPTGPAANASIMIVAGEPTQ